MNQVSHLNRLTGNQLFRLKTMYNGGEPIRVIKDSLRTIPTRIVDAIIAELISTGELTERVKAGPPLTKVDTLPEATKNALNEILGSTTSLTPSQICGVLKKSYNITLYPQTVRTYLERRSMFRKSKPTPSETNLDR